MTELWAVPCSSGPLPMPAARPALLALPSLQFGEKQGKTLMGGLERALGALTADGTKSPVVVGAAEGSVGPRLPPNGARGLAAHWPPSVLVMPQRVTVLGGYLNYPSALIRQPGERKGEAGREGQEAVGAPCPQPGWHVPLAGV